MADPGNGGPEPYGAGAEPVQTLRPVRCFVTPFKSTRATSVLLSSTRNTMYDAKYINDIT